MSDCLNLKALQALNLGVAGAEFAWRDQWYKSARCSDDNSDAISSVLFLYDACRQVFCKANTKQFPGCSEQPKGWDVRVTNKRETKSKTGWASMCSSREQNRSTVLVRSVQHSTS